MASSTRHICRSLRQVSRGIKPTRTTLVHLRCRRSRSFSSALQRFADDPASTGKAPAHWAGKDATSSKPNSSPSANDSELLDESQLLTPEIPYTIDDLTPEERADYEVLSKTDQAGYLRIQNHIKALMESGDTGGDMMQYVDQADREIERKGDSVEIDFPTTRAKGPEIGYWAEEEDDEFGQMEDADDDWSAEDITAVAHSELDLHRDIREYTRIAAWDLPLLQQYARPFQPPNHSTPLRFRYTTYMGESHPASRKVVVEFCTKDLLSNPASTHKLNEQQRIKLIKLAGPRYNPDTDVIRMSSEKFESAAQNKRYLGELVGTLIKEAKDNRDEFKDVPFDFRHHKPRKILKFPEEWKLSDKTQVKRLAAQREQQKLLPLEASPVDGAEVVEQYVRVGAIKQTRALR